MLRLCALLRDPLTVEFSVHRKMDAHVHAPRLPTDLEFRRDRDLPAVSAASPLPLGRP
jgi:hypothetical protein